MPGVLEFLLLQTPVLGHIVDASTQRGIRGAHLSLPDLDFAYNETKRSSKAGRYFLWLPDGWHRVLISAEGYESQSVEVMVDSKVAQEVDVHMVALSRGGGGGDDVYDDLQIVGIAVGAVLGLGLTAMVVQRAMKMTNRGDEKDGLDPLLV
jgi:hypothetical protein